MIKRGKLKVWNGEVPWIPLAEAGARMRRAVLRVKQEG